MKDVLDLLARVCLAFIFLYEAYDSIFYFQETKAKMISYGLSWNPNFLLVAAIIILVLGGTLLLIGYRTSFGVFLLMLYWIPLTLVIHSFWNDPEPEKRLQAILFMKNIAILGGLLMVYVNDSGRYSIKRLFATTKVPGT